MEDNWSVDILKSWKLGDLCIYECYPYYTPRGTYPPYPGFEILKIWLNINCPSAAYEVTFKNGQSALEVTFNDPEEAMLFRLRCT
jgi:hypothetical protein